MNQGIAATPSGVSIGVNFFVDGSPVSTSDNNIISLVPGASVTLTANLGPGGGAGLSTWTASTGNHTVLAQVDPLGRITESSKSNNSLSNTITIAAAPPAFVIGDRVQTTANLTVYATASTSGTILGQEALGALGTVVDGPTTVSGVVWWNINFDIGADGWTIQDNLAKVTPLPTVSLTANPTSITSGGSSTLTWSSTNATSCTGTGFTAGGTSGSATVSPTASQSYSITCTGTGGTAAPSSATITVSATTLTALHCPSGGFSGLTLTDGSMNDLQENCTINGNLVIGGTGTNASLLNIGQSIVLTVVGNINLSGSGALSVNGGTLALANQYNLQWNINATDNANISMLNGIVTTNALGTRNLTSALYANGNTNIQVVNSTLDRTNNWLIAKMGNSSSFSGTNSTVPTELYLNGQNSISVTGNQSQHGLHLGLGSGTSGTLTLPNTTTNYTWSAGSSTGLQVGWNVAVTNAQPGLSIESHANSNWTIIGANVSTKELSVSVNLDPATSPTGTVTLNQLPLGIVGAGTPFSLTFPWSSQPQLTLNNVNLGPLAWQIYIGSGPAPVNAQISNSAINEIGVIAGNVTVTNSTLQLAELDPVGPLSVMNVQGSDIWSHIVQASSGGQITIQNSTIHGNLFSANGCKSGVCSVITLTNVTEAKNGTQSSCSGDITTIIQSNGTPLCDPYSPLQGTSTFTTSSGGIINR
jgi:hypothetical protein